MLLFELSEETCVICDHIIQVIDIWEAQCEQIPICPAVQTSTAE